ncbi:iron chaperone [Nocardia sp. NPDC003693]
MAVASTVQEYIAQFPPEVREVLETIRATVHEAVPGGTDAISYQIPAVKLDGKVVVFYGGWAEHVSVYPVPEGDAAFEGAIAPYRAGKGTLKFPLSEPIPYELIGQVAARLAERRGTA